jgi:hypothetical protein
VPVDAGLLDPGVPETRQERPALDPPAGRELGRQLAVPGLTEQVGMALLVNLQVGIRVLVHDLSFRPSYPQDGGVGRLLPA